MAEKVRTSNRQSVARLAAKGIARTTAKRAVTDSFGNGIFGTLLKAAVSFGITKADKAVSKKKYNKDFGIWE